VRAIREEAQQTLTMSRDALLLADRILARHTARCEANAAPKLT
jgi:hypothetical protein